MVIKSSPAYKNDRTLFLGEAPQEKKFGLDEVNLSWCECCHHSCTGQRLWKREKLTDFMRCRYSCYASLQVTEALM